IAIGLFLFWPRAYPGFVIESGDITLTNGGVSIQRGAPLTTDEGGTFILGGEPRKEIVFLDQGRLDVAVKKNKGTFDIMVEQAVVHVTGTQFEVDVVSVLNEEDAQYQKRMRV